MAITLQIIGFHNCDGCSQKVEKKLSKIGVKMVELDREKGNVTIATSKPPEEVRRYLQEKLKKSVIVVSRDEVPARQNQTPSRVVSHRSPANRANDLQELGLAAFRCSPFLNGVEITSTNSMSINFNHREDNPPGFKPEHSGYVGVRIRDPGVEYGSPQPPQWATTEPSAPPKPTKEHVVYGHPPEYYGFRTTRNHYDRNGCCNIM